jgi:hypothetical protein
MAQVENVKIQLSCKLGTKKMTNETEFGEFVVFKRVKGDCGHARQRIRVLYYIVYIDAIYCI